MVTLTFSPKYLGNLIAHGIVILVTNQVFAHLPVKNVVSWTWTWPWPLTFNLKLVDNQIEVNDIAKLHSTLCTCLKVSCHYLDPSAKIQIHPADTCYICHKKSMQAECLLSHGMFNSVLNALQSTWPLTSLIETAKCLFYSDPVCKRRTLWVMIWW